MAKDKKHKSKEKKSEKGFPDLMYMSLKGYKNTNEGEYEFSDGLESLASIADKRIGIYKFVGVKRLEKYITLEPVGKKPRSNAIL